MFLEYNTLGVQLIAVLVPVIGVLFSNLGARNNKKKFHLVHMYLLLVQNSSISKKILDGLQSGSDSLGSDNVKVKPAASSNPGVPPSSLMSFMRKVIAIGFIKPWEFNFPNLISFFPCYSL